MPSISDDLSKEAEVEDKTETRLRRGGHGGDDVTLAGQELLWFVSKDGEHHPHLFLFDEDDKTSPLHVRTKGVPDISACARIDLLDEIRCPFRYGRNYIVPSGVSGEAWLLELRDIRLYDGQMILGFVDRVRGPDYGYVWMTDEFVNECRFPGETDHCPIDEFEFDFTPCTVELAYQ